MLRRTARILLVIFCVAMLAQQTNLGSFLAGAECSEPCPDDLDRGHCSLGCVTCTCATHGSMLSLAEPASAPVAGFLARVESEPFALVFDPRADTIFHVPRPNLT